MHREVITCPNFTVLSKCSIIGSLLINLLILSLTSEVSTSLEISLDVGTPKAFAALCRYDLRIGVRSSSPEFIIRRAVRRLHPSICDSLQVLS